MSKSAFDDKFGFELLSSAPTGPGVYRFSNDAGLVLYVGKAKNLRRRLANYRNATRRRVHRKMRILVREAAKLTFESCDSEQAALLREGELIRKLRPEYNVDGAFAFLYPSFGLHLEGHRLLLCFTTQPDAYAHLGLAWYGCFRSRPRAKQAFHAMVDLMEFVAHRDRSAQLPEHPRLKGSHLVGLRRVPAELRDELHAFFVGEHTTLLSKLSRLLLDKPQALKRAAEVQTSLEALAHFFEADASRLRSALARLGLSSHHVAQDERDALFIRAAAQQA